jgi:hypothetical protein
MSSPALFRICLLAATLIVPNNLMAATADAICFRTPAMALRVTTSEDGAGTTMAQTEGYRIATIRRDPLLHQRWAMVASCGHPERPLIAMLLPEQRVDAAPASKSNSTEDRRSDPFPIVHAGDLVQLLVSEKNLRMEIVGKAEESGTLGSTVRVRQLNSGFDIGREQTFVGIVRGPGKIEIQP